MRKVIGIGETILDILFRDKQPQKAVPGGSTFNCMISLGRCRIPALFISELGKDRIGDLVKEFMEENNLITDYIYFYDKGQSPVSIAFLNENKDAEYSFYKNFPSDRLDIELPDMEENDIVIVSSYFAVNPLLRKKVLGLLYKAKEKKSVIYYDINFRKPHAKERESLLENVMENFRLASIIRCSREDLSVLFPGQSPDDVYKSYIAPYRKVMIITQGEKEILIKTPSSEMIYDVNPIVPVSTIGAGDNFNAGLVYGLMEKNISLPELNELSEREWENLVDKAKLFAAEVCGSYDNYVSIQFAEKLKYK
ncbi:MAG: carbohydrate kinase [Bacteroidales bacterium]|nr:carbohydrate kinase [Bacteroidales bacterium]